MAKLLYYGSPLICAEANHHLPGIKRFTQLFKIISKGVCFIDRQGVIQTPVRTAVWDPIPTFRATTKTYEELCNERALEILAQADALNLPLYVFYSGGIDSTLVLVSLLKNASPKQVERIVVLLTRDSIAENPTFFRDHIIGKLKVRSAIPYPLLLSKRGVFVCGELNDQLFGSDLIRTVAKTVGEDAIHARYNRDHLLKAWSGRFEDQASLHWCLDLFEQIKARSPVPIETNANFLWWLNFSAKWQGVDLRLLTYMFDLNQRDFDRTFVERHFYAFFGTEGFQLWSMNNPDKKIGGTWESYKFTAKDVIYEFHKDDDYRRHKTKIGSLYWVFIHQIPKNFITDDFTMHSDLPAEDWYEPRNSFLE